MAVKNNMEIDELAHKSHDDVLPQGHRYVYGESTSPATPGFAVRPNKKGTARKVSTFYLIVALFFVGISTVAYINNVIVVNRLAAEINQKQLLFGKISNTNAVLRSEINRKSGWERIGKIASEQIGLRYVKEPPTPFDVDQDVMDQARKSSPSQ